MISAVTVQLCGEDRNQDSSGQEAQLRRGGNDGRDPSVKQGGHAGRKQPKGLCEEGVCTRF